MQRWFYIQGSFIFGALLLCGTPGCTSESEEPKDVTPNIIFILADDMGYGDIETLNPGSNIPTPHLNSLAEESLTCTNAHAPAAVCTPTRYSFLTGRYSWRSRMKRGVSWIWEAPLLNKNEYTIASMLSENGYHTALIGKWHLGWSWPTVDNKTAMEANGENVDYNRAIENGPTTLGFDYYYGSDVPSFPPHAFIENDKVTQIPSEQWGPGRGGAPGAMIPGWQYEDLLPTLSNKAIEYVKDRAKEDRPFFLFYSLSAPHTPIAPSAEFHGTSDAGRYGDFVVEIDAYMGQLFHVLDSLRLDENTIVIFTSDNGPTNMDGENYIGKVGSILEYGHNSSGEYRGLKSDSWEAGHRVPFFVRWPGKVEAGSTSDALVSLVDMMATCASIAGAVLPDTLAADSYDMTSLWRGETDRVRRDLVVQSGNGILSLIDGQWKLITSSGGGGLWSEKGEIAQLGPDSVWTNVQLYDLKVDPSESNNLAAVNPLQVRRMMESLASRIRNGRTTQGPALSNDGEETWSAIEWISGIDEGE